MNIYDQKGLEALESSAGSGMTHNTLPLLHEVRHALGRLLRTGESTIIDLRAMPFGPGDEERLLGLLGQGEVQAMLEVLGKTTITESRFSGVWIIDHYNSEAERIAFQIEVIEIPELLRAQREDMQESLDALDAVLETKIQPRE